MKFLIDAQLPSSLKRLFFSKGYDCIHTLGLPLQNDTPDRIINYVSVSEQRIVITKDGDFLDSFILKQEPYKLILVKLGTVLKMNYLNSLQISLMKLLRK
jgi:predicted nuclease of predicted toxin-antitoxin system